MSGNNVVNINLNKFAAYVLKKYNIYIILGIFATVANYFFCVYVYKNEFFGKPEYKLSEAIKSREKGDFNTAISLLEELKNEYPRDINGLILLADAFMKKGEIDKAYSELESVIKTKPDSSWALKLMGNLYFMKKDYTEAELYYLRAIKCDSKDINVGWVYHDLAQMYVAMNKIKKACEAEKMALKCMPDNVTVSDSCKKFNSIIKKI